MQDAVHFMEQSSSRFRVSLTLRNSTVINLYLLSFLKHDVMWFWCHCVHCKDVKWMSKVCIEPKPNDVSVCPVVYWVVPVGGADRSTRTNRLLPAWKLQKPWSRIRSTCRATATDSFEFSGFQLHIDEISQNIYDIIIRNAMKMVH